MDNSLSTIVQILATLFGGGIFLWGILGRSNLKFPVIQTIMSCLGASLICFSLYCLLYALITKVEPPYFYVGIISLAVGIVVSLVCYFLLIKTTFKVTVEDIENENESKSTVSNRGNNHIIDIDFTLHTNNPPIDIAKVILHIQGQRIKAVGPPFKLERSPQSHVSTFELSDSECHWQPIGPDDKYHLTITALGKPWSSNEFSIHYKGVRVCL